MVKENSCNSKTQKYPEKWSDIKRVFDLEGVLLYHSVGAILLIYSTSKWSSRKKRSFLNAT